MGEGVGKAFGGGGDGGPHRRAEQPEIGCAGRIWCNADAAEGVQTFALHSRSCSAELRPALGMKKSAELGELLGKIVAGGAGCFALAAKSEGVELAATGRAANAEIDAAGKHSMQCAEDFSDFERSVMRKHDAAGADADARCGGG